MALPPEETPQGAPEWIVTYGDMMSLLLCFFVLLAAMSEPKSPMSDTRVQALIESVLEQFGDTNAISRFRETIAMNQHTRRTGSTVDVRPDPSATNRRLAAAGSEGKPGSKMRIETIRDGMRLTIGAPLLFEPGLAVLNEDAKAAILEVASSLRGKFHMIEVRAYPPPGTLPTGCPYATPEELAFARARAVARFLATDGGLREELIRLAVAAPLEARTIPALSTGETAFDRVDITTMESIPRDFSRGANTAPNPVP
jgi:chemotaxis protein MotB